MNLELKILFSQRGQPSSDWGRFVPLVRASPSIAAWGTFVDPDIKVSRRVMVTDVAGDSVSADFDDEAFWPHAEQLFSSSSGVFVTSMAEPKHDSGELPRPLARVSFHTLFIGEEGGWRDGYALYRVNMQHPSFVSHVSRHLLDSLSAEMVSVFEEMGGCFAAVGGREQQDSLVPELMFRGAGVPDVASEPTDLILGLGYVFMIQPRALERIGGLDALRRQLSVHSIRAVDFGGEGGAMVRVGSDSDDSRERMPAVVDFFEPHLYRGTRFLHRSWTALGLLGQSSGTPSSQPSQNGRTCSCM